MCICQHGSHSSTRRPVQKTAQVVIDGKIITLGGDRKSTRLGSQLHHWVRFIDKIIEKLLYIFAGISYNERNCEL